MKRWKCAFKKRKGHIQQAPSDNILQLLWNRKTFHQMRFLNEPECMQSALNAERFYYFLPIIFIEGSYFSSSCAHIADATSSCQGLERSRAEQLDRQKGIKRGQFVLV